MIKQIDMLGMRVDNYTVRESMLRLDSYMNHTVLNVIETVTMQQLIMAIENPVIKECLDICDLSVIGDKEILAESGNMSMQRMREVKDKEFMQEFIRRIVRNQKKVYLVGRTQTDIEKAKKFFTYLTPKFSLIDSYALEECEGDKDDIVNEINGEAPDIVLSVLPSPYEEEFILEHKDKISAGVWYGLGMGYTKKNEVFSIGSRTGHFLRKLQLRQAMRKYEKRIKGRK